MPVKRTSIAIAFVATSIIIPAHAEMVASASTNTAWQSSAAVGLTLSRGNSDTTLFSITIGTEKKWSMNDLTLGADAIYGDTRQSGASKSTETADAQHGAVQYNRLFSERFYAFGRVDLLHDAIANIQYRLTVAPGAGYYLIKRKATDLSVEAGPAYVAEKLGNHYENFATLRVGERFHHALSDHAKVWEAADFLPQVDHFDNYVLTSEVGAEAGLNKGNTLSLRSVLQDAYDNIPALGRLKNDLKLIVSIAYKF